MSIALGHSSHSLPRSLRPLCCGAWRGARRRLGETEAEQSRAEAASRPVSLASSPPRLPASLSVSGLDGDCTE
uniref:Nramp transporter n=1 Tax=Arundo donax TaxID=35708 RepID=A0A0A9DGE0_ARUDO